MIQELSSFDTCILSDAVEKLGIQLRNRGFTLPGLHYFGDPHGTVAGYAVTARIRTAEPPITGRTFFHHTDWWDKIQQSPAPRIVVIQDIDKHPGAGACLGMIGAAIFSGLGCVGAITNGSVRDVNAISATGFRLFADHLSPSHAYAHLVEHSCPVEIHGLTVHPGDLLVADRHGVVAIPSESAPKVCELAADLQRRKRDFVAFCRPDRFSIDDMDNELRKLQL